MTEGQTSRPPSARQMVALTAGALLAASLIVFGAIPPAEFNWDPLGLGRMTGLNRLWAPREVAFDGGQSAVPLAHDYSQSSLRSHIIEIPLTAEGDRTGQNDLEYKVRMSRDATLVYQWSVSGITNPEEFYFDFHGQTTTPGAETTVASYRQATGTSASGALTAPFDGIHGWYFQNQSLKPVVVRVRISGFYDIIPPGEAGNEAGILAKALADQASEKP